MQKFILNTNVIAEKIMEISQISELIWKNHFLNILAILIICYAISWVFITLFRKFLQVFNIIPQGFYLKRFIKIPTWLLLSLIAFKLTLPGYHYSDKILEIIEKPWRIAMITVSSFLLIKIVSFLKELIFKNFEKNIQDEFKFRKFRTQFLFIENSAVVFICIIALTSILMSFDGVRKIGGSLIASAGLAGIILGFAAQKTLSNLIAGFQLAFTQPVKLGDTVIVDGEWGHIHEITLTYVVLRTWDIRNLVIPITYLLEKPFQNWTRANEKTTGSIIFYVDYMAPVEEIRKEFMRLVKESQFWDGENASLFVIDATEKSMQLRGTVSAKTSDDAFFLKVYVRENLIKYIRMHHPQCFPKSRIDLPASIKQSSADI